MADRSYYRVGPAIWDEPWSDDARYVAFYILTCRHRTTEGLFRLPIEYAVADLGWPVERFRKGFAELLAEGFIAYDETARVCLIRKALEWQAPENPNQVKAAVKKVAELPQTDLVRSLYSASLLHSERLAEGLRERFGERLAEPIAEPPSPSPSSNSFSEEEEVRSVNQRRNQNVPRLIGDVLREATA